MEIILLLVLVLVVAVAVVGGLFMFRQQQAQQDALAAQLASQVTDSVAGTMIEAMRAQEVRTVKAVAEEREAASARALSQTVEVAGQALKSETDKSVAELDKRTDVFETQIKSMSQDFSKLTDMVQRLQRGTETQAARIDEQLKATARDAKELQSTTQGLREALASKQTRGQWGERMAEDVLQAAGMKKGINYDTQRVLANGNRPDFTFNLPEGLVVNMDVKFPYENYVRFLESEDAAEQDRLRAQFATDVKTHIKALAKKGYIDADSTVDYVMMFVPNESVYAFLHENDADILDFSLRQKVVLTSPSTLFAVLGVIRASIDNFKYEKASNEILEVLASFRDQWERFCVQVDKVETHLERTHKAFDELKGTRSRQLERQMDKIDAIRNEVDQPELWSAESRPELREITESAS